MDHDWSSVLRQWLNSILDLLHHGNVPDDEMYLWICEHVEYMLAYKAHLEASPLNGESSND